MNFLNLNNVTDKEGNNKEVLFWKKGSHSFDIGNSSISSIILYTTGAYPIPMASFTSGFIFGTGGATIGLAGIYAGAWVFSGYLEKIGGLAFRTTSGPLPPSAFTIDATIAHLVISKSGSTVTVDYYYI